MMGPIRMKGYKDFSPRVNQSFGALKSAFIGPLAQLLASLEVA
jgi:hypothetical protein